MSAEAAVYLDSSAIVKLVVAEAESRCGDGSGFLHRAGSICEDRGNHRSERRNRGIRLAGRQWSP